MPRLVGDDELHQVAVVAEGPAVPFELLLGWGRVGLLERDGHLGAVFEGVVYPLARMGHSEELSVRSAEQGRLVEAPRVGLLAVEVGGAQRQPGDVLDAVATGDVEGTVFDCDFDSEVIHFYCQLSLNGPAEFSDVRGEIEEDD